MKVNKYLGNIKQNTTLIIIGLLLLIVRTPFYLTRHVQEDAFISWRCAKNIIDYGVYGFNPNEAVSASSSHLYVFISAIVYFVTGNYFIISMLIINSVIFIFAALLISKTLFDDKNDIALFWVLISILPISLVISYSGMETSLLLFAIAILIYNLRFNKHDKIAFLILFLLPFIRPDAVLAAFIYLFTLYFFKKKIDIKSIIVFVAGIIMFLAFNKMYFSTFLNQSVVAKSLSLQQNSIWNVFDNLTRLPEILFLPIATKYFLKIGWIFISIYVLGIIMYVLDDKKIKNNYSIPYMIILLAFLYPLAYAVGGGMFPWYFWPSQYFIHCIIVVFIIKLFHRNIAFKKSLIALSGILLFALILGQWVLSLNTGTQEFKYRAFIGRYLNSISKPEESIMLEPIGYIPYFANRYTHDEVGLASPNVTRYRKKFGKKWWIAYVKKYKPDYLIERDHILNFRTLDNYLLAEDEKKWFNDNYEMIKHFKYNPDNYTVDRFLLYFLRLGGHADYYLFKRKVNS